MKRIIVLFVITASVALALSSGSEARIFGIGKGANITSSAGIISYTDVLGRFTRVTRGNTVIVYLR